MANKRKLLIIGASGHGRVVADIALRQNKWSKIVFLDDNEHANNFMGINVVGSTKDAYLFINEYDIIVAIGDNNIRKNIVNKIEAAGGSIPVLVHPCATIGSNVELGAGTVIMAGAVINCCTKIGKGCIINTAATIDHDNVIEEFVHISPGVHTAGGVTIGHNSWIGIGAIISNNITIISNCIVGAGAVVLSDIKDDGTYVGVPATRIKK